MSTLAYIGFFIAVIAGMGILANIAVRIRERKVVSDRYVWFAILSEYEWKGTLRMKKEMAELKGTTLASIVVYEDMICLKEEGFVEVRKETNAPVAFRHWFLPRKEYRLTYFGIEEKGTIPPTITVTC